MWYNILYSICVGCLIAGLLLVGVLLFLSASSLSTVNHEINSDSDGSNIDHIDHDLNSDSDFDHDLGTHIDHDVDGSSIDHDIYTDSDFDHDLGTHIDHDVDGTHIDHDVDGTHIDHDVDGTHIDHDADSDFQHDSGIHINHEGNIFSSDLIESKGKTPLSLKFSLYLLWFGTFGTFLYDVLLLKVLWISLTIFLSILFSSLVSRFWQKIARNSAYRIHLGNDLLGRQATVKIPVSTEGGVISVNTYDAVQTLSARTLHPLAYYYSGDQVFICRVKNQEYFVDDNPEKVELPQNHPIKRNNHGGSKIN
ncbi:MAG: hypothetical protein ACTSYI_15570 [Promethearchaeota archaeon]